ncbi:MAG TPA: type II toxin-antitoxin system VapC family toxin [Verrucomicrobiae bacterium]|nr:type II toxin-antitoxin system VapC family toxin [Verrucomicrobiae bacterium]
MPETFVLDCSVAAKWVFPEPDRAAAMDLFERWSSGEIFLIAPALLLAEFASLVAKRNRRREISGAQAAEADSMMTACSPRLYETRPLILPSLALSLRYQLSLWDCVYLALAIEHNCPVYTADQRLVRAGKNRYPSIRLVQDLA